MKKLSIAYFGSPDFSGNFLEKILTDEDLKKIIDVKLAVTQPDRPVGRDQILTPTPVKKIAIKNNVEVLEIEKGKFDENCKSKIDSCDLALVYAFSAIIPEDILGLPKYGFWCIHPSLLPKYRGTSPMASALINGEKTTGVTIIKMDEKIDHGPIIAQKRYEILAADRRPDLEQKLTNLAFEMFKNLMRSESNDFFASWEVRSETSTPTKSKKSVTELLTEQNHQKATYTKKLIKDLGFIPFENLKTKIGNSPQELFNLYRGLYPWPGIWTIIPNGKRLKITEMKMENGKLKLYKVQLEGKKEVDFKTFNKAYKLL